MDPKSALTILEQQDVSGLARSRSRSRSRGPIRERERERERAERRAELFEDRGRSFSGRTRSYHYCRKLRLRAARRRFAAGSSASFCLPGDEPRTPRRYAPFSTTAASLRQ